MFVLCVCVCGCFTVCVTSRGEVTVTERAEPESEETKLGFVTAFILELNLSCDNTGAEVCADRETGGRVFDCENTGFASGSASVCFPGNF